MSFWSRMAGSLNYARVDTESISALIPQISSAFIQSRIRLVEIVARFIFFNFKIIFYLI